MSSTNYDSAVIGISISARPVRSAAGPPRLELAGPGSATVADVSRDHREPDVASCFRICAKSGNNWDDWEGG